VTIAGAKLPLNQPWGPGCGVCALGSCELFADVTIRCDLAYVALAVCAGSHGEPPCIDTTSPPGSFVYPNGDLYDSAQLRAPAAVLRTMPSGMLDFDATLDASRSSGSMSAPVHIHVCGTVRVQPIPC
jgi:hypothetical protein